MFQSAWNFLIENFFPKFCLYCGSFLNHKNGYCSCCWAELKKKINPQRRKIRTPSGRELKVLSLFDWIPQESDLLSEMILGLKGKRKIRLWKFWSEQFLLYQNLFQEQGLIVPCWNKSSDPEHAEIFAKQLQRQLEGRTRLRILSYDHVFPQSPTGLSFKKLGRKQRKDQLHDHEIFSQNLTEKLSEKVIFVDDILTTGSSAEIAFLSLGKPLHYEVWCLAYRTNLAPSKGF